MTWARLDDQTAQSPAWIALTDAALRSASVDLYGESPPKISEEARRRARDAKAVHLLTLMWSVPALTDGKISPAGVEQICAIGSLTVEEWYAAADLLVEAGAWRRLKPSKSSPLGAYQMRLGWAPGEQPTREEDQNRRRRARLRDRLREGAADYPNRVIAVDRAKGQCEYCDARLVGGGQIDHIDPTLFSNDPENLAHVCASCNKRKGHHPLDVVGMAFTKRAAKLRREWKKGR